VRRLLLVNASTSRSRASGAEQVQPPEQHGRWSWHLGRLFGIEVRVHATFLVLLAWVALSHLMLHQGWRMAAGGVLYVLAVFAIVVVHELAHALTARRFGIATRDILLLPIGGVSRIGAHADQALAGVARRDRGSDGQYRAGLRAPRSASRGHRSDRADGCRAARSWLISGSGS
jgi:hypothetical protein